MRVLQINSVCGTGSTGRIAADLYKMLEENGHECCIAYGRGTAPRGLNTIKIGTKLDVYYHGIMSRITDKHGFYSKHATKVFIEKVKKYNPDIIHLHNIHGYYINIELLFRYLKKSEKPVIWTLHDCWAFTGHCSHFQYINCDRWKSKCFDCPQKKEYPRSLLRDASTQNYNRKKMLFTSLSNLAIVTPSHWLFDVVQNSFFSCNNSIYHIPNGIDTSIFKKNNTERKSALHSGKTIVLGVANIWSPRKGLYDFMKLSQLLDKNQYQIILVGVTLKQKKCLPQTIIGIERTESIEELVILYSEADVYVNLTYEDNFPTTNLEALSCGTPVISYKTGGSIESATICITKGDIEGVANAICLKQYNCGKSQNSYHVLDRKTVAQLYLNQYEKMS